jgi:sugar phosphate isomerase/epimerase
VTKISAACWTTAGACDPWDPAGDDTSPLSLEQRMTWAAEAGFVGFGIRYRDLLVAEKKIGLEGILALKEKLGFDFLELEFIEHWYCEDRSNPRWSQQVEDFVRFADGLAPRHIKVGPEVDGRPFDREAFVSGIERLSAKFLPSGANLAVEAMPFADISNPFELEEVLKNLALPNVGIVLDVWHIASRGIPFAELENLDLRGIILVELSDGRLSNGAPTLADTVDTRLFPGDGDMEVIGFCRQLLSMGYEGPWGVEMLSTQFRRMDPTTAIHTSWLSANTVLEKAKN